MSGPTREQIEAELADLKRGDDLPEAGLCSLFSADSLEWIDHGERIVRLDGQLYHVHESIHTAIFK